MIKYCDLKKINSAYGDELREAMQRMATFLETYRQE